MKEKKRDGMADRRTTDEQLKHVENLLERANDRLNESLEVAQTAPITRFEVVTDIQQRSY